MTAFGDRLKELRTEKNISQAKLADILSLKQSTVSMWENGKNCPEHASLLKLSEFFGVSIDYLTGQHANLYSCTVPVLGYVRAGLPSEAYENVLGYEDIIINDNDSANYFALKIKGDSMSPRMMDGDTVIVRKQSDCENGDICVAMVGSSEATVKKIIKKNYGIILMPLNSCYEPLVFTSDDIERMPVSILGKVTELRAKI